MSKKDDEDAPNEFLLDPGGILVAGDVEGRYHAIAAVPDPVCECPPRRPRWWHRYALVTIFTDGICPECGRKVGSDGTEIHQR